MNNRSKQIPVPKILERTQFSQDLGRLDERDILLFIPVILRYLGGGGEARKRFWFAGVEQELNIW